MRGPDLKYFFACLADREAEKIWDAIVAGDNYEIGRLMKGYLGRSIEMTLDDERTWTDDDKHNDPRAGQAGAINKVAGK